MRIHRLPGFILAAAVALSLAPAAAQASGVSAGTTALVDRPGGGAPLPSDGGGYSSASGAQAISGNGNRVVFESEADGLLEAGADTSQSYVFVRDRAAQTTTNVCRASGAAGVLGNEDCMQGSISNDGQYVVFLTASTNLSPDDTDSAYSVYARDLTTQTTTLVSRASGIAGASAGAFDALSPSVGDNGRVAFQTTAKLVANDTTFLSDVYVRSLVTNTTVLISRTLAGPPSSGNGGSSWPIISGDGTAVVFQSLATNIASDPGADSNGFADVYYSPSDGSAAPELMSRAGKSGTPGGSYSSEPSINTDGTKIAFTTHAPNLPGPGTDTNGWADVIRKTPSSGLTELVSVPVAGGAFAGNSTTPKISGDGKRVAFYGPSDSAGFTTYVRDVLAATTTVAGRRDGAAGEITSGLPNGLNATGNLVVLSQELDLSLPGTLVYIRDTGAATTTLVSANTGSATLANDVGGSYVGGLRPISEDGRYVVFVARGGGLVPGVRGAHIYRRDLLTGAVVLVDQDVAPDYDTLEGGGLSVTADGGTVAYVGDQPGTLTRELVLRHIDAATTNVVAPRAGGLLAVPDLSAVQLNRDGTKAVIATTDSLVAADGNASRDLYLLDVASGLVQLASVPQGATSAIGGLGYDEPAISADGTKVAFVATGPGLAPGDTGTADAVFLRDLAAGTTTLVSRANGAAGATGDSAAQLMDISADGNRVSFSTNANNLDNGDNQKNADIHVRDIAAGTTIWASQTSSGAFPDQSAEGGSLSADGQRVAFWSDSTNLVPGDTNGSGDLFMRDLKTGQVTLLSVSSSGAQVSPVNSLVWLSGNGHCAVFGSSSNELVSGGYPSKDFAHVYVRAIDASCPGPQVAGGGSVTPPAASDTTAPALTKLKLSRKAFATKGKKKGTALTLTLSEAATLKVAIAKVTPGKKKGAKCVAPKKAKKKAKKCERLAASKTLRTVQAKAGPNTVKFDGKLGKKQLGRGTYRFLLTATDAAGNAGTASILFKVK